MVMNNWISTGKDLKYPRWLIILFLFFKTRERFLACLHSILSIPQMQFTEEERDMLQKFKKLIGRGNLMKVNDQKLLSEMSEVRKIVE